MKSIALTALLVGQAGVFVPFTPARVLQTAVPAQPPTVLGGGEVLLELTVSSTGEVRDTQVLRVTPPFTPLVVEAVRRWRFAPAMRRDSPKAQQRPVEAKVLVAAIFRPPTLYNAPTPGEPPKDVGSPSNQVPFPSQITVPLYPPQALFDGVVVVEAAVSPEGRVSDAKVVGGGSGFEQVAVDAGRQWRFRPAAESTTTYAYLIFGFRQPVTTPGAPVR